jgi:predicted amidohydrolase YtcJ
MKSHMPWIGLVLALASLSANSQRNAPDLILVNGKVFTSDAAHPYVEALAIRGERIVAVGSSDVIGALAGNRTRRIDLAGRVVIPGLNDAHDHLAVEPKDLVEVTTRNFNPDWAELRAALAAKAASTPAGTLLEAGFADKVFNDLSVNRDSLDAVTADHPVALITFTGHAWILNSAGLERAGIHADVADPQGGRFERDTAGLLTGVLREYAALDAERNLADATSDADAKRSLRETLEHAAAWGITTIQDMSNEMAPERAVRLLEALPTPIRVRVMRMPGTTPAGRNVEEGRGVPAHPSALITVTGTKWMLDGVPLEFTFDARGSHKGWRDLPSADELERVLPLTFPEAEMQAMLRETLRDNDSLLLHVSGYPAARAMLQQMEASGGPPVWASRRVRFEHGDGLFPDLIPQAKALGIVVVQNPTHFAVLGEDVQKVAQPVRSLLAAGIPVALGSDGPLNPYLNIMLAVTHPHQHSEGITREQAVIAYTRGSAYAEFAETDKGTLEPGKLADLAVLSQDIFTVPLPELPKTKALLTLVGGKVAYDAGQLQLTP